MLELLVVLAVIGVIAAAGWRAVHPGAVALAAQGVRGFLRWGRLEAMWSGRVVAIVPTGPGALSARVSDRVEEACLAPAFRTFQMDPYGAVRVDRQFRSGIIWLPSGGARSCAGGGVISDRMILAGNGQRASVLVSSLGRVRVEVSR